MGLIERMQAGLLTVVHAVLLASALLGACAASGPAARTAGNRVTSQGTRVRDSDDDVVYYQARAAALATETPEEIGRTDFARLRRGRLYLRDAASPNEEGALQDALTTAFDGNDSVALLDTTAKILSNDQADIRAHMLRSLTLRKMNRSGEGDFHRMVAIGLIDSIVRTGDGRGMKSAWTVYRVKEEYEVLKVLGCLVQSQALKSEGGGFFDVLVGRKTQGGGMVQIYFDITELFAEQRKNVL